MTIKSEDQSAMAVVINPAQEMPSFVERRQNPGSPPGVERRQFSNSYGELSPESQELANAEPG